MARQSKVAFVIDTLPAARGVELFARTHMMDEMKFVMMGGEEFLLVLTIPSDKLEEAHTITASRHVPLIEIGNVEEGERVVYESSEGYINIPFTGYDNFKEWS